MGPDFDLGRRKKEEVEISREVGRRGKEVRREGEITRENIRRESREVIVDASTPGVGCHESRKTIIRKETQRRRFRTKEPFQTGRKRKTQKEGNPKRDLPAGP